MRHHFFVSLAVLAPATTFAATISQRDLGPAPSSALPYSAHYVGCYVDSVGARVLNRTFYYDSSGMTVQSCISYCYGKGYDISGVEYSSECYCGTSLPPQKADDGCTMPCSGDSTEACGGPNRLSVYSTPEPGYTYAGCFVDSVSNRQLSAASYDDGTLTNDKCIDFCTSKGYSIAGTEYSGECYCGTSLPPQQSTNCNMACSGDPNEICGGPDALTVYKGVQTRTGPVAGSGQPDWHLLGCYTDNVSARSLSPRVDTPGGPSALTVALCTQTCEQGGFIYAGVEYSQECYCGNTVDNGGVPAMDGCNMVCSGNSSEFCGGPNWLDLYQLNGSSPPSSSSTTSASSTATSNVNTSSYILTSSTIVSQSSAVITSSTTSFQKTTMISASTTTVTITSTTVSTSAVTTVTSSTTSTVAPSPSCLPTIATGGDVSNGGFENGNSPSPWQTSGVAGLTGFVTYGYEYEGCRAFEVSPGTNSSTSYRYYTITYPATFNSGVLPGTYRSLNFYVGRRSNGPTSSTPNVNVYVPCPGCQNPSGPYSYSTSTCSGSACNLSGSAGTVWKQISVNNILIGGYNPENLQITISWPPGSTTDVVDDILIDVALLFRS